jgi:endonuclease-3
MKKKTESGQRTGKILAALAGLYPGAGTALRYGSPFQLLVAVMLSAQCTDKQVNIITSELFKKYSKPEDFAGLDWEELSARIKGCGLYRSKSRNIVNTSRILVEKHGSQVPGRREDLEALPGVGRKTANVVLNIAFDRPVMPVDTHVFRVSRRLGLSSGRTPAAVENDLISIIPPDQMGSLHHCLILHGRTVCRARRPRCGGCALAGLCETNRRSVKGTGLLTTNSNPDPHATISGTTNDEN